MLFFSNLGAVHVATVFHLTFRIIITEDRLAHLGYEYAHKSP